MELLTDPSIWVAFATLTLLELVLDRAFTDLNPEEAVVLMRHPDGEYQRVASRRRPEAFQACFAAWVRSLPQRPDHKLYLLIVGLPFAELPAWALTHVPAIQFSGTRLASVGLRIMQQNACSATVEALRYEHAHVKS
mgnify:CR=1 FL=1